MVFSRSIDLPLLGSSIDHTLECIVAITLIWYRLSMHGYLICRHCKVVTLTAGRWDVHVRINTDLGNFTFLLFLHCPTLDSIQQSRCNICLVKMPLRSKWHSLIAQTQPSPLCLSYYYLVCDFQLKSSVLFYCWSSYILKAIMLMALNYFQFDQFIPTLHWDVLWLGNYPVKCVDH